MARLIKPGMLFQAECLPYAGQGGLETTMSCYGIPDLEGAPRSRVTYVVCRDGSIQDHWDRQRPIGWELIEDDDQWFYRVTQMNHERKPLSVFYMGTTDDVPNGRGRIGSVVVAARVLDTPQSAEITEQFDDGTDVTSACPGAPVKAPPEFETFLNTVRNTCEAATQDTFKGTALEGVAKNLSPQLAACAALVNDPVQTDAIAKFAEGKLSYAEMRALCG